MKRWVLSGLIAMFCITTSVAQEPGKSDRKGGDSKVMLEAVVSGHLANLNGKYKLRVTEGSYNPGGYVTNHHHAGPGLRVLTAGEWTQTSPDGKSILYKAGDAWFESGDVTHSSLNKGKVPAVILNFEIIPVDWKGPTLIPPKSK